MEDFERRCKDPLILSAEKFEGKKKKKYMESTVWQAVEH